MINKIIFILVISFFLLDFKGLNILYYIYKAFKNYNYLNIFIIAHKDFQTFINNKFYKILCDEIYQFKNKYIISIIESKNDNELFFKKNGYSEGSKIYYVWKQYKNNIFKSKYVGFNHYRRIFSFGNNIPNLDDIFKDYDIILNKHSNLPYSLKKQYYLFHNKDDIDEILEIIKYKFPQYYSIANETLNSNLFYLGNIFIMKKEDFIKYGNFTFEILFEFDKKHNLKKDDDIKNYVNKNYNKYKRFDINLQRRLEGFLMERISNIFYNYNFKKKYEISLVSNNYLNSDIKKKKNSKIFLILEIIIIIILLYLYIFLFLKIEKEKKKIL